MITVFRRVSY